MASTYLNILGGFGVGYHFAQNESYQREVLQGKNQIFGSLMNIEHILSVGSVASVFFNQYSLPVRLLIKIGNVAAPILGSAYFIAALLEDSKIYSLVARVINKKILPERYQIIDKFSPRVSRAMSYSLEHSGKIMQLFMRLAGVFMILRGQRAYGISFLVSLETKNINYLRIVPRKIKIFLEKHILPIISNIGILLTGGLLSRVISFCDLISTTHRGNLFVTHTADRFLMWLQKRVIGYSTDLPLDYLEGPLNVQPISFQDIQRILSRPQIRVDEQGLQSGSYLKINPPHCTKSVLGVELPEAGSLERLVSLFDRVNWERQYRVVLLKLSDDERFIDFLKGQFPDRRVFNAFESFLEGEVTPELVQRFLPTVLRRLRIFQQLVAKLEENGINVDQFMNQADRLLQNPVVFNIAPAILNPALRFILSDGAAQTIERFLSEQPQLINVVDQVIPGLNPRERLGPNGIDLEMINRGIQVALLFLRNASSKLPFETVDGLVLELAQRKGIAKERYLANLLRENLQHLIDGLEGEGGEEIIIGDQEELEICLGHGKKITAFLEMIYERDRILFEDIFLKVLVEGGKYCSRGVKRALKEIVEETLIPYHSEERGSDPRRDDPNETLFRNIFMDLRKLRFKQVGVDRELIYARQQGEDELQYAMKIAFANALQKNFLSDVHIYDFIKGVISLGVEPLTEYQRNEIGVKKVFVRRLLGLMNDSSTFYPIYQNRIEKFFKENEKYLGKIYLYVHQQINSDAILTDEQKEVLIDALGDLDTLRRNVIELFLYYLGVLKLEEA